MTTREEMTQRIERAMERYEAQRMKPGKRRKWSLIKHYGARIPLQEPRRTAGLREAVENV